MKRDRVKGPPSPFMSVKRRQLWARPSGHPVDVSSVFGHIVIDDVTHAGDVDAARGHVVAT